MDKPMLTLCIRYTFNPNKLNEFRTYAQDEQTVITRCGGKIVGYFLPTDFAGPTNEALGLIDFPNLAEYEKYRQKLLDDPEHKRNVSRLEASGAIAAMERSIIRREESAR